MNEVKVQRNYKDSIFRMLFRDKENLLNLCNALNRTYYTDVDELEITTLENAEDGVERGRKLELEQGEIRLNKLHSILLDMGRLDDLKRATQDKAYQEQLMSELLPEEVLNK